MKTVNYMPPSGPMQGYATVPATSDAKEYLRLLLRHKLGLLLTLALGVGLATLYLISKAPTYEASTLLEVSESGSLTGADSTPSWAPPKDLKQEANILRSRKVLTPVVDNFQLRNVVEPKKIPVLGDVTLRVPMLAEWIGSLAFAKQYAWSETNVEVTDFSVPKNWEDEPLTLVSLGNDTYSLQHNNQAIIDSAKVGESIVVQMPPSDEQLKLQIGAIDAPEGVRFDLTRLSVQTTISDLSQNLITETTDAKSSMITIKLRGEDPAQTADLVNAIAEEYSAVKLASERKDADAQLAFYRGSLPSVEADYLAAQEALAAYRMEIGSYSQNSQVQNALQQMNRLDAQLSDLNIELAQKQARYTVDHPDIRRLEKDIAEIRTERRVYSGRVARSPIVERELALKENDVATTLELFNDTRDKLNKLERDQQAYVSQVTLVDTALTPRKPISPNPLLAMVGGTLATLFLYMLYLTLRSALSTVISDQESLERASGLPVFINIPKSSAQRKIASKLVTTTDPTKLLPGKSSGGKELVAADNNVLALNRPDDYSVENLRGLRSMLEDVMDGAPNNVLMITSPLPSMGKSFVSMNLAVLLAQAGKRVLLIDADYQRGQLHKSLGLPMGPGLPEVVRGKSELKETVKPTSVQNLYCIPRGFMGSEVGRELPSDKEFGAFMQVVAPRFDIAIIDTPPVLSVATAAALGKHAGSSIMVIKEGEVKEPQLTEALKRLSFSGVRVNGCILNGSATPTPRHYAYYREQVD
jgi:tyrosine-protein kinase Etk/Wzc